MIDCNITKNYFNEKQRMTKRYKYGGCQIECTDCPLSSLNNDATDKMTCREFETLCPEQAISIVQRWSDTHPQKTYLTEFLKQYPKALLNDTGTPKGVCLYELGVTNLDNCEVDNACIKCWNQPIKNNEEGGENG